MNDLLSICIPTYNRAVILHGMLKQIIPQAEPHAIAIYVSDNASSDNTAEVIASWKSRYPHIYYNRNAVKVESGNIPIALKMSQAKYAWLLGDRCRLYDGAITTILHIIQQREPDLLIVNAGMKLNARGFAWRESEYLKLINDIPSAMYSDNNRLLAELGWYMVLVGSTVFKESASKSINFTKYAPLISFGHAIAVFEYLAQGGCSVYWCDDKLIYTAPGGTSGWVHDTFAVWIDERITSAAALPPSYAEAAKNAWIKAGGVQSGLFSIKAMAFLRGNGIYTLSKYKEYYHKFPLVSNTPRFALLLVALIPSFLMKAVERIVRLFVPDLVKIPPKK